MLRKYRYLAVGLIVTAAIVLGCLLVPGLLLHMDSRRELGKIQQADQLYYADNVNASDAVDFDLSTRLLMKSGQWKSEKTQIAPEDIPEGDAILPEDDMRLFGGDIFSFLAIVLWSDDYYIFDVAESFDEAGKDYIHQLTGYTFDESSMENAEGEESAKEDIAAEEEHAAGENMEQYDETKAVEAPESFLFKLEAAAYKDSLLKLYKYEDKVLNSYYFYMWEYRILDEELGIDVCFEIDAVTLEVYNISFHGRLFDSLPWIDALNVIWDYRATEMNSYYHPWAEISESSFSAISPTVTIPAFVSAYWMGTMTYTAGFSSMASFYQENGMLTTREKGYAFEDGNFMMDSPTNCTLEDASDWVRLENEEGDFVYANLESGSGGFDWYLAAERT